MGYKITFADEDHSYTIEGKPVISVTKVLDVIDFGKSGKLTWWAQKIGVEGVLKLVDRGYNISGKEPWQVSKELTKQKLSIANSKSGAGERGTAIHKAWETYAETGLVPSPIDYPESYRGYIHSLAKWIVLYDPEPIAVEEVIGSKEHLYAGTFDAIVKIKGAVERIDFKTASGIRSTNMLQLAAYEAADIEMNNRSTEKQAVVLLKADGAFVDKDPKQYAYRPESATFEAFLHALSLYRHMEALENSMVELGQIKKW